MRRSFFPGAVALACALFPLRAESVPLFIEYRFADPERNILQVSFLIDAIPLPGGDVLLLREVSEIEVEPFDGVQTFLGPQPVTSATDLADGDGEPAPPVVSFSGNKVDFAAGGFVFDSGGLFTETVNRDRGLSLAAAVVVTGPTEAIAPYDPGSYALRGTGAAPPEVPLPPALLLLATGIAGLLAARLRT